MSSTLGHARHAVRRLWRSPAVVAGLYGLSVTAALVAGLVSSGPLPLVGRPEPSHAEWAAMFIEQPHRVVAMGWRLLGLWLGYVVISAWPVAWSLARLHRRRWVFALGRGGLRVLGLRCATVLFSALLLASWGAAARAVFVHSASWIDERLAVAAQVIVALPIAVAWLGALRLLHLAQAAAIAEDLPVFASTGRALDTLRQHTGPAVWLWLAQCTLWIVATGAGIIAGVSTDPLIAAFGPQLTVVFKLGVAVWGWSVALTLVRSESFQTAPADQRPRIVPARPPG